MSAPVCKRAWLCLVLAGCVGSTSAQHLYFGPEKPAAEVAELHGVVEYVDGQRVSGGKFALLPGCHVVQPPTSMGQGNAQGATWTKLPELHFSVQMLPGRRYQIATGAGHMDGSGSGSASVQAAEIDAAGAVVQTFPAFAGPGSVHACEAEASATTAL
jgi:hypothetical protein